MIKNLYETLLQNLHDGVFFIDKEEKISFWNLGAEKITGYSKSETIGKKCSDKIIICIDEKGTSLCDELCPVKHTLSDGTPRQHEVYLHHKDGHRAPALIRAFPIHDEEGNTIGAAEVFYDNSPKVVLPQRTRELAQMSLLDPLTEVGNKSYLEMHLNTRIEEMKRYQIPFGILFIDIDNFKGVNDEYGTLVGDKILMMVAQTISNNIRFFDIVGRWGGEEFIVSVLNVDEAKLNLVANKLRLLIGQSTIIIRDRLHGVTVSIGATKARSRDTVESLTQRANKLMLQSKRLGKNLVSTQPID